MTTRGDTFHILQGHVMAANIPTLKQANAARPGSNAFSLGKNRSRAKGGSMGVYCYNSAAHAVNKF